MWEGMSPLKSGGRSELPTVIDFGGHNIYGASGDAKPLNASQQEAVMKNATSLNFTSPAQDAKSGKQPDYYLNDKGQLIKNPNAQPSKDGSTTIEVQSKNKSEVDAKKLADQMQKAQIKDLINYFKDSHPPGTKIPQDWLDMLSKEPDLPPAPTPLPTDGLPQQPTDTPAQPQQPAPSDNPQPQPQASQPQAGGDSGAGGAPSGGGGGGGGGGGDSGAGSIPGASSPGGTYTGTLDGLLNSDQQAFANELVKQTGLNQQVVEAWVLAEESGSAAQGRSAEHNNDWLNIGYTDSATYGAKNDVWNDPKTAADATAAWIKGQWDDPGFGKSAPSIQHIMDTVGQSPDAQISAIQNSGWASSHYPNLKQDYDMVVQADNNIHNANSVASGNDVPQGDLSARIAQAGLDVGGREGTVGNCLKGVEDSLDSIGINLPRMPDAKDLSPILKNDARFQQINPADAKPGDILVYSNPQALGASEGHGHITIAEANGMEASDHMQQNVQGFGTPEVFRAKEPDKTQTASNSDTHKSDNNHA